MKTKSSILIETMLKDKFGEKILYEWDYEKYPDVESVFADGEEAEENILTDEECEEDKKKGEKKSPPSKKV